MLKISVRGQSKRGWGVGPQKEISLVERERGGGEEDTGPCKQNEEDVHCPSK